MPVRGQGVKLNQYKTEEGKVFRIWACALSY